jgi:beta-galactosidase GanA
VRLSLTVAVVAGGLPWWLAQQGADATTLPDHRSWQLRVRTSDPAYMHRVELFYTKLFALLRAHSLTAGQGGPIVMAQIENEYGSYGSDKVYLAQLRDLWRKGLGDGVVIHSTVRPPSLSPALHRRIHRGSLS